MPRREEKRHSCGENDASCPLFAPRLPPSRDGTRAFPCARHLLPRREEKRHSCGEKGASRPLFAPRLPPPRGGTLAFPCAHYAGCTTGEHAPLPLFFPRKRAAPRHRRTERAPRDPAKQLSFAAFGREKSPETLPGGLFPRRSAEGARHVQSMKKPALASRFFLHSTFVEISKVIPLRDRRMRDR